MKITVRILRMAKTFVLDVIKFAVKGNFCNFPISLCPETHRTRLTRLKGKPTELVGYSETGKSDCEKPKRITFH